MAKGVCIMTFDFKTPPIDNIAYFMAKTKELHFDYDEIMHEAHHKTFSIAKITQIDLLYDIKQSLQKALAQEQSFNTWKKGIKPTLQKAGWLGKTIVTNPNTKEQKEIFVGSTRLKTIYYTNIRTSYNQTRAREQYSLPNSTYLRYVAIDDNRVRQSHKALHGLILHRDHAFWKTCYPPNDWNCRCRVQAYTKEQIEKRGWKISENPPYFKPHKDWDYDTRNLASSHNTLQKAIEYKMKYYENRDKVSYEALRHIELEAKKEVWKQGLEEMIQAILIDRNLKHPRNIIQIGQMPISIIQSLRKYINIESKSLGIVMNKGTFWHIREERKGLYNQNLRLEEIRDIVDILQDVNTKVFIDTKLQNILYVWEDKLDTTKMNKIAIYMNRTIKKFGITNAIATLSKIDKIIINDNVRKGLYKEVQHE